MYTTQDLEANPIRLFQLPNTLAGDGAVTIIVQCILTWFVELGLVHYDLGNRSIRPIGFIPEPKRPWLRRLFMLDLNAEPGTGQRADLSKLQAVVHHALRGFMFAVVGFLLLWPIGVGALTSVGESSGGDYLYDEKWTPQAFKAILGGVLSLLTTPLMALFWLIKAGWEAETSDAEEAVQSS
jgi:hypothetical protein